MTNYYSIDRYDTNKNSYCERVAVWSTNKKSCAYADYMRRILRKGGSWEAPDGCIYSIHEEEGD